MPDQPDRPPADHPAPAGPGSDDDAWAALREVGSVDLDSVAAPRGRSGERPVLQAVDVDPTNLVTVELRHRGRRAVATEEGGEQPRGVERAAARATVRALADLLPPGVAELHLDWIEILAPPTPQRPHAVHATVALRSGSGEVLLAGSALFTDDAVGAAARSVLDAVNRRFSELTAGPSYDRGTPQP